MIIFEDITWSNFLSTGNNPTKINVKLGKGRYKPNTSAYEVEMIPMLDMCFRKLVNS